MRVFRGARVPCRCHGRRSARGPRTPAQGVGRRDRRRRRVRADRPPDARARGRDPQADGRRRGRPPPAARAADAGARDRRVPDPSTCACRCGCGCRRGSRPSTGCWPRARRPRTTRSTTSTSARPATPRRTRCCTRSARRSARTRVAVQELVARRRRRAGASRARSPPGAQDAPRPHPRAGEVAPDRRRLDLRRDLRRQRRARRRVRDRRRACPAPPAARASCSPPGWSRAVASALSMATGAFLAERSEAEVTEANVERERQEIVEHPEEEREELSLFYQLKGIDAADRRRARRADGRHPRRCSTRSSVEEFGVAGRRAATTPRRRRWPPGCRPGSARSCPVIPFIFTTGTVAIVARRGRLADRALPRRRREVAGDAAQPGGRPGLEMTLAGVIVGRRDLRRRPGAADLSRRRLPCRGRASSAGGASSATSGLSASARGPECGRSASGVGRGARRPSSAELGGRGAGRRWPRARAGSGRASACSAAASTGTPAPRPPAAARSDPPSARAGAQPPDVASVGQHLEHPLDVGQRCDRRHPLGPGL